MSKLVFEEIVQLPLKAGQFFSDKYGKKQIVIHHTVSSGKATSAQNTWNTTPERIATAFIIDGEGKINQCFSSAEWAHHLGCKTKNNTQLNRESIGIEICSWGGIKKKNGKFFNVYGYEVKAEEVVDLGKPWRGYQYYHKYNEKQLNSLKVLLEYLAFTYKIPITYNEDMWDISKKALNHNPGIYTHVSYRADKSDCFPQPELIETLKSLTLESYTTIKPSEPKVEKTPAKPVINKQTKPKVNGRK